MYDMTDQMEVLRGQVDKDPRGQDIPLLLFDLLPNPQNIFVYLYKP